MLKHLVLSVVTFFHHHRQPVSKPPLNTVSVAKPALNVGLLDRTSDQLLSPEPPKLICVYPVNDKK